MTFSFENDMSILATSEYKECPLVSHTLTKTSGCNTSRIYFCIDGIHFSYCLNCPYTNIAVFILFFSVVIY